MSNGMSDGHALGNQHAKLREAVFQLRDALKVAESGHRGLVSFSGDEEDMCELNYILRDSGYELRRTKP